MSIVFCKTNYNCIPYERDKNHEKTFLYKEVAERIAALVAGGTFRIGDRLPSIREMSRQAQVSINTVKIAYSHLEDRCLIEGRPQSGYYVCPRPLDLPREPKISLRKLEPQEISSSNLVWQLMKDIVDSEKVQFGAAIPDPELVPARKLGRILSVACRNHAAESICYLISRHDYDDEPFIYLKSISL